jgi:murein endopeptidase
VGAAAPPAHPIASATFAPSVASASSSPSASVVTSAVPGCDDVTPPETVAGMDAPEDSAETADDGYDPPPMPSASASSHYPVDALSDSELDEKLRDDPASLGSIALGRPHGGALVNAAEMPPGPHWELVSLTHVYATREAIDGVTKAIEAVNAQFPDSPKSYIGDFGAKNGGYLPPHVSHQMGRDVDISYYLTAGQQHWYALATAQNLDLPRTWAFVRAFITESDVEVMFMATRVQKLLKAYAISIGEDRAWLDEVFQTGGKSARPLIFDVPGHGTHIHVRFYSGASREVGRRAYAYLVKHKMVHRGSPFMSHTVKAKETLVQMALKFHTTPSAIRKANHMASSHVVRGHTYLIPRSQGVEYIGVRFDLPPRRLPPTNPVPPGSVAASASTGQARPCAPPSSSVEPPK